MNKNIVDTIKGIFAFPMSLLRRPDDAALTIVESAPPTIEEQEAVIEPVPTIVESALMATKGQAAVAEQPVHAITESAPTVIKEQAAITRPASVKARRALTVRRNRDRRILDDWKLVQDTMGYKPFTPSQYHAALSNAGVKISIAAMYVHLENLRKRRHVVLHSQRPIMYKKRGTPPEAVVPVDTKQRTSPIG